jgi:hypothetical protein
VRRGVSSPLPLLYCRLSLLQPGCPRQELSDEVLKQAAPLAKLSRSKARGLDPDVALPARAHSRVAGVRCHARVCRVATLIRPLSSSPARHRRTDKTPPRRLLTRLLPLRHHCCALLRARTRQLYLRTEPSPPSLPHRAGRVASTHMVNYTSLLRVMLLLLEGE